MGNGPPLKYELNPDELNNLETILTKYIKSSEEEIRNFFKSSETQSPILDFGYLDNGRFVIKDPNGPKDYSITMYKYYEIDKIPINLEIRNIGALLSKNGIIYKILIFSSFWAKILNKSINKEDAKAKVDEYLSKLEDNDYNYFESKFKISKNYIKLVKSSYDKLYKMFSKRALIYTIITAASGIGGCILYIFTGMVGLFIAPPIITILGIIFFYFIKKKKNWRLFRKEKFMEFSKNCRKNSGVFWETRKYGKE